MTYDSLKATSVTGTEPLGSRFYFTLIFEHFEIPTRMNLT